MEEAIRSILLDPVVARLLAAVALVAVVHAGFGFGRRLLRRRIDQPGIRYRAGKLAGFGEALIIFVGLALIFSDRLQGLTIAFGLAGAGVAFALQEVIASIAGWFAIAFARFYKVGDRIQLGGVRGDVMDVGVLRTTLMEVGEWVDGDLYSGRIVRMANSFVFKEPVFNYSDDFPFLWDEVKLPVAYGSDFALARRLFAEVAEEVVGDYSRQARDTWASVVRKYVIETAAVEPTISVTVNDNWMEFTIRFVVDYKRRRSTKDRIFSRAIEEMQASEGRVKLGSSSFDLGAAPALRVRVEPSPGADGPP